MYISVKRYDKEYLYINGDSEELNFEMYDDWDDGELYTVQEGKMKEKWKGEEI